MGEKTTCQDCGYVFDSQTLEPGLEGLCPKCLAGVAKTESTAPPVEEPASKQATIYNPFRPGATFRGLKIEGLLGKGGMGVVYKARQTNLDRTVALKVLAPQYAASPEFIQRFEREAKILASVNHTNVTQVYEFGREEDFLFLVLEYVEGQDLESIFNKRTAINTARFLQVMREVTKALEAVHGAGLIHRDIKPANILLTKKGTTKLTDFGLAVDTEDKAKLTESGFFVGTPHYVSPEHVQGKKVDGRSDLYSLGVIIYQGIAGRPPFNAPSNTALLMKHVQEPPPPLYKYAPNAPKEVGEIVRKLLAKNPASRHDSAGALLQDLDRAIEVAKTQPTTKRAEAGDIRIVESEGASPKTRRASAPVPEKKLPLKLIGGGVAAAVLIIVALVFLFGGSDEKPKQKYSTDLTAKAQAPETPALVKAQAPAEVPPPPKKPEHPIPVTPDAPPQATPKPAPRKTRPEALSNPSNKILEKALSEGDALLAAARKLYDQGNAEKSAALLTQAGFKAEEAKQKYQAVVELAEGAGRDMARRKIRAVQQLQKLAGEAKLAVARPAPAPAVPKPRPPTAKPAPKAVVDPKPAPDPGAVTPKPDPLPKPKRLPVPATADLTKMQRKIRELFKDDYKRRSATDIQVLAQRLLRSAEESVEDSTERFVLLREARDLAGQAGDFETSIAAIEEMGKRYEIDVFSDTLEVLGKAASRVRSTEVALGASRSFLDLARRAYAENRYDVAITASGKAGPLARVGKDKELESEARDLSAKATFMKAERSKLSRYLKVLATKPDDSRANLAVGKFTCFIEGDWGKGIPMLAKASDLSLKKLATDELAGPTDSAAYLKLGDGWWSYGQKEKNSELRKAILGRGIHWFQKAILGATGLSRVQTEERLRTADFFLPSPLAEIGRTETEGGTEGAAFQDLPQKRALLVGLKTTIGRINVATIVKSVQPVYLRDGKTFSGETYGQPLGNPTEHLAKPGYAIAGIVAKGFSRVDGFKIIFMRIKGLALDPRDSYESDWIGGKGGRPEKKLGGDGSYIVGLHGSCADDLDNLGLIYLK